MRWALLALLALPTAACGYTSTTEPYQEEEVTEAKQIPTPLPIVTLVD